MATMTPTQNDNVVPKTPVIWTNPQRRSLKSPIMPKHKVEHCWPRTTLLQYVSSLFAESCKKLFEPLKLYILGELNLHSKNFMCFEKLRLTQRMHKAANTTKMCVSCDHWQSDFTCFRGTAQAAKRNVKQTYISNVSILRSFAQRMNFPDCNASERSW